MKPVISLVMFFLVLATRQAGAQTLLLPVTNQTGTFLDIWKREGSATQYELVSRQLDNGLRQPVPFAAAPARIAVSVQRGAFKYFGPFDETELGKIELVIDARVAYETRTKTGWWWNGCRRRWERRSYNVHVAHEVLEAYIKRTTAKGVETERIESRDSETPIQKAAPRLSK